jgi:hypothetical protein
LAKFIHTESLPVLHKNFLSDGRLLV